VQRVAGPVDVEVAEGDQVVRPRVVPATLRNDAGIVGAAMAAVEKFVEG